MIKYLVSDLDGVLRHWHNEALFRFEEDNGLDLGYLFKRAFRDDQLFPAMLGHISHELWLENVYEEVKVLISADLARSLIQHWQTSPFSIDSDLIGDYQTIFPGVPIILASNATSSLNSDLQKTSLPTILKYVINSSEIALAKPDLRFFQVVLKSLNCSADEVIFIDDLKENVDAAISLGIHGVHFTSRETCREALNALRQTVT